MKEYVVEKQVDKEVSTKTGVLKDDKYDEIWSDKSQTPARVSMTVGSSIEYGYIKVSATVTLACDQNEKMIDRAGELGFYKAMELAEDALREAVARQEQLEKKG